MTTSTRDPTPASSPAPARGAPKGAVNWFRFWMQMLVALVAFNIIAGLVTWFVIFPRIFPGRQ